MIRFLRSQRCLHAAIVLGLVASLVACGGGGGDSAGGGGTVGGTAENVVVSATVPGFANPIDIYKPVGATQAVVMLHGGAGTKSGVAYQLGLNSSDTSVSVNTANWDWLSANKVMMVVPQGMSIASEPSAWTWSNHVMTSGQDDVAFLQALAAQLRSNYPSLTRITLMGHSNGGMMANRMWCESPETFDAYVGIAGPASAYYLDADTPCSPSVVKPYMGLVGDSDTVLRTTGDWEGPTWTVKSSLVLSSFHAWETDQLIAEWPQQQYRTNLMCAETLSAVGFTNAGQVDTWTHCGGKMVLKRVLGADHYLDTIETQLGASTTPSTNLMDTVIAYLSGL
jgi:polyhydroxybutyrate depolymerase